jgi:hypothetical protein
MGGTGVLSEKLRYGLDLSNTAFPEHTVSGI